MGNGDKTSEQSYQSCQNIFKLEVSGVNTATCVKKVLYSTLPVKNYQFSLNTSVCICWKKSYTHYMTITDRKQFIQ